MLDSLNLFENGLLILVVLVSSIICSTILIVTNPKISKIWWIIRWTGISLLYPNKFISKDYVDNIPFILPNNSGIITFIGITIFLLYDLMIGTKKGRQVRKKFRILPKLMPLNNETEEIITENLDGSNRQLKGELIKNERQILKELLGEDSPGELNELEEADGMIISEEEEPIPLANQNFAAMKGKIESVAKEQEYCAMCSKPVEKKWKVCPFCGEFLEIYDND